MIKTSSPSKSDVPDTNRQFEEVIAECRDLFVRKLQDYGPSWRIMRPSSLTDQIFIKAKRIRSIETKGVALVDEGIRPELIAIVNYGIIALIQLEFGYSDRVDIDSEWAVREYDRQAKAALELMKKKNSSLTHFTHGMKATLSALLFQKKLSNSL